MGDDEFDLNELDCGMRVCCNTVSGDGFGPENLLNRRGNSVGFRSEYFIRPPVMLNFHFPFPVRLQEISWDSTVGNNSSLFHQVFGSSEGVSCRCSDYCTVHSSGQVANLCLLGRGDASNGRILFRIPGRGQGGGWMLGNRDTREIVRSVTHLQLKIVKTLGTSLPVMRNLKIIVQTNNPEHRMILARAKMKHSQTVADVLTFFGGEKSDVEAVDNTIIGQKSSSKTQKYSSERVDDAEEIPPEFLDEITQEMMLIPMVLPSGKSVDRSTVDKCNESQSLYGGPSRDPFTGKIYSAITQPVFNACLKSRIDRFLLDHPQHNRPQSGRTLGDARAIEKFLESKTHGKRPAEDMQASYARKKLS